MISMIVIYDSLTGQTKRFAQSLGLETISISEFNFNRDDEILLATRSHGFGKIPRYNTKLLKVWHKKLSE